ncbi:Plasma membrane t-SNARE, secretory vesicle fusion [Mortierella sp. AM989]|nr:Plasma membrane t-SNARE, secretory vesicle fusion [Mortierella sp. AM989]
MSGRDRLADFQNQYGQQQNQSQQNQQYDQDYGQQGQYAQHDHYYQQYPPEGPYAQQNQHALGDQYAQQDQYAQGDQYPQHNQYVQQGQYSQDQYAQHGQYSQQGQYAQQNQYAQQSQYPQQGQHAQQNQHSQQQEFAQQQQAQYQEQKYPPPTRIEMSSVASSTDMNVFFGEVTSIQDDIAKLEQNITKIEELHEVSVNSVSTEEQAVRANRQLEEITSDTSQLSNRIKKRIKDIELANLGLGNSPDIQIRRTQAVTLKDKFLTSLRRYQTAESEARKKYQGRMERQIKIVKPDATQEEVEQVLGGDNQQIFAQSVLQSTRYGDANRALREVQSRHNDIIKIEKTIIELQQLFNDMETLVTEQAIILETAEQNVHQTDNHLTEGNVQVDTAIANARSARKKKWICLIITIIIIAAIVLIVLGATTNAPFTHSHCCLLAACTQSLSMEHPQATEDHRDPTVISTLSPALSTPADGPEHNDLRPTSHEVPSAPSSPSTGKKQRLKLSSNRLLSLDLLRGLAIFIMITVNAQMGHPDWIGFTIADTVFPSFLFITGCTIPLSVRADANAPNHIYRSHAIRIFKRSLIIWGLGIVLNLYGLVQLHVGFDEFRWPNVLNRIGFCYLIVGWMHVLVLWRGRQPEKPLSAAYLLTSQGQTSISRPNGFEIDTKRDTTRTSEDKFTKEGQDDHGVWPWFVRVTLPYYLPISCLLVWLICTYSVQVDGCPSRGMVETPECSAQAYFDLRIFGKAHTYRHLAFDPEGSLSTLTSILNVWFGWFIGCTVQSLNAQVKQLGVDFKARREAQGQGEEHKSLVEQVLEQEMLTRIYTEHLSQWFWLGILWMFVGWVFSLGLPLSKPSWTATFAVFSAGVSQMMLAIFFYKFDAQPKIKELRQLHLENQAYRSNNQLSRHYHHDSAADRRHSDPESLQSNASNKLNYSSALELYFRVDHFFRHWFRKSIIIILGSMGRNAILLYMCSELVQGTCSLIPGGPADPITGESDNLCTSAFNHTWGALDIGGWGSLFYSLGFTALHVLLAIFLDHKKWYFKV